jgi:hypothetical protein
MNLQKVIFADELPDGKFLVDEKVTLTAEELKKLCKLMPGCQLVIFTDARKK